MRSALVLLVILVAGCVDDAQPPRLNLAQEVAVGLPPIEWNVAESVDWWENYVTTYVKRDAYLPNNDRARDHIIEAMKQIGFDVELRTYPGEVAGEQLPSAAPLEIDAIVATRVGTELPNHRIGLVSHYDTQAATIQGAYDDGSGVAAQMAICEALAKVETRRTIACIFFDAEEMGLVASKRYVEDVVLEGDEPYVYDIVIGYDMTGINYPGHEWKAYLMTGDAEAVPYLKPFGSDLLNGVMGYPEEGVEVLDTHDRNSDERRFRDAGVPIYRFAGGRHAADYPEYHRPGDTVDFVYDFVGGRANFEAGLATIVEASYNLILALDATSIQEMAHRYR